MYYKIIYTVKEDFEGHVSIKRRQQPYSHNLLADPAETRDVSGGGERAVKLYDTM